MTRLVNEIATYIRGRVSNAVATISGDGELRSIFHGPPMRFLERLLEQLEVSGGVEAELATGERCVVPVVLPVPAWDRPNPPVGESGRCDENHILNLRNTPDAKRFLVLAAPARHSILSIAQATDELGVSSLTNGGSAGIEELWDDPFFQHLVTAALSRTKWSSDSKRSGAILLLEQAVIAADEFERHSAQRDNSWNALARVLSISDSRHSFGTLWSLACGFPPMANGEIDAREQTKVLQRLADAFLEEGFSPCLDRLKLSATPEESSALDSLLSHLRARCEVHSDLARCASFLYAPFWNDAIGDPPDWWLLLPTERLAALLDQDTQPEGALAIICTNPLFPAGRGLPTVVLSRPSLTITVPPEASDAASAVISRQSSRPSEKRDWLVTLPIGEPVVDDSAPLHKQALRYTATAEGLETSTLRLISLERWEHGVILSCRSAKKVSLPKKLSKSPVDIECSVVLQGEGKHFIDLYVSPNHQLSSDVRGLDTTAAATDESVLEAAISLASPEQYGLEIVATSECQFDLTLVTPENETRTLRVNATCDDAAVEGCRTEFERLVRLNRQSSFASVVVPDRQSRISGLESWCLAADDVVDSCYPIALGSDCDDAWLKPQWHSEEGTVLSRAGFLHDPRPRQEEFTPPSSFLEARARIAERIRATDEGFGLTDLAELGDWLRDKDFAADLDAYLRSYSKWISEEPDIACWADTMIVCGVERDGSTLAQEPDAVLFSPIHPIRLAWHALAQGAMLDAIKVNLPCPAASILNPDAVPDAFALPLRTPAGGIRRVLYLSVECSSDYWSVLWNASRLDRLNGTDGIKPFGSEFGLRLGGVSSSFSVSQVKRALDDIGGTLLTAKPTLNVLITSSPGQTEACTEGLMAWAREEFTQSPQAPEASFSLGPRQLNVFDERPDSNRPEQAAVANLAEDTGNSTKWFSSMPDGNRPDLGIIAQLDASNANVEVSETGSPIGVGGLIRHRIRTQLNAGNGAFLTESRMASPGAPSGNGLADLLSSCIERLENLGDSRFGFTFAPSVSAISSILNDKCAEFAAVSSSAVDPACFLGGWLQDLYLWDYELPSYSHRAGDTNGYYLLSRVRPLDCDTLGHLLKTLPNCDSLGSEFLSSILLEVARRGMPTIRGLSASHSGASGDLGLFLAGRLLQDEFRTTTSKSLLSVSTAKGATQELALVIPVDPFRGYLSDLRRAIGIDDFLRPDLLIFGLSISDSSVKCKITPVEVKYRKAEVMGLTDRLAALFQASSMSVLLTALSEKSKTTEFLLWKLAFQHLLLSMSDFAFRVYSQQLTTSGHTREWSALHQRVTAAILSDELNLEIDQRGRLIIFDRSNSSAPHDMDRDEFTETIVVSPADAGKIVNDGAQALYDAIRSAVGDWQIFPKRPPVQAQVDKSSPNTGAEARTIEAKPEKESLDVPAETPPPDSTRTTEAPHPEAASPLQPDGMQILVGQTASGFTSEARFLYPSDTALNQLNMGVVGDLGTGKTQLLKSLIYQIRNSSPRNGGIQPRFLIFDYKKDYTSEDFVKTLGVKVVKPFRLPLNLFDVTHAAGESAPWLSRFKFFADVLDKIFSNVGPVQRENLKQSVKQAYDQAEHMGRQPTIYDIHDRYRERLQDKPDAPLSIIGDIVDMELFCRDPEKAVSFDDFLDGTVVISLDSLGQDDHTKNMLVAIMLNMFYEHMLQLPKRPYRGIDPQLRTVDSYLLVDEADNIMRYEFDVLRKVLLQGREFGVGVILASQYLKHFKAGATDYREPLLSWFIHKVPNITAQELVALGLPSANAQMADEIRQLPNHWCLYKSLGVAGEIVRGEPFYKLAKT